MSREQQNDADKDRRLNPGRELIVIANAEVGLRASTTRVASVTGFDVSPIAGILSAANARLTSLFGASEERLRALSHTVTREGGPALDLSVFYTVTAADDRLDDLAAQFAEQDAIEAAYVKPPAEMPAGAEMDAIVPSPEDAPPASPDLTPRQIYLDAAPAGIDARFAWTLTGGGGAGIRIIDIEGAWRFTHEDLVQSQGGVIGGTPSVDIGWRNHGTAVIGEFGGDSNGIGVTGICPDANTRAISVFGLGTARAISQAAMALGPGDIILLELHRPGPRFSHQSRSDQRGYIAVEWWPDDFAAIRFATAQRGVVVVEAAGNGAEDLDDAIYSQPGTGFPANWTNPFNRSNRDSGAVVVGAGAPPPGTHGRDHGPDRSRLGFSNFGALVDAQAWGREVTTCGYGDLQGGSNEDLWYTDRFSGTSSASPIVVGALGSVQGILRARSQPLHTPAQMRAMLRATGSGQTDAPGRPRTERIGNRPNLHEMIQGLPGGGGTQHSLAPLYRYWNPSIGDHFYTTDFGELGQGRYGWQLDGVQCYVFSTAHPGTFPLYRYWNPGIGDHFYTTDFGELGQGSCGWQLDGIQCYVQSQPAAGSLPLYGYWNPSVGDHFYTTNFAELGQGDQGWQLDRIQCYVYPQQLISIPSDANQPAVARTFSVEEGPPENIPLLSPADAGQAIADVSELTDRVVPGSFSRIADVDGGIGRSFEMRPQNRPGDGQPASFSSFETEKRGSAGGVSITINVNKEN